MRFGRVMVVLGALASLGLAAAGVQGYRGVARAEGLSEHILVALVALLLLVLAHAWVLFYLLGVVRVLSEAAHEAGREDVMEPGLLDFGRRTLPPLLATVAAGVATFVLGSATVAGQAGGTVHATLLWVTLALQGWAVVVEWRALAASERAAVALRA